MKLIRKIFGGISLTAAMFVFQACYGTPEWEEDINCVDFDVRVLSAAPTTIPNCTSPTRSSLS